MAELIEQQNDILPEPITATDEIVMDDDLDSEDGEEGYTSKGKIYTDQSDPEIESLHGKFKRGRLNVQPSYQRLFVWDITKSSRLIESALLDIPLPVVYLSEDQDGKENVIDGQQRLTSFFSFIDGKFPDGSDFKLTKLKVFSEYNGSRFNQLPEGIQDKIRYYKLRTIKFKKESDQDLQFEIFERLNTGSVSLNDQELRNCVYRGKFNDLLKELAGFTDFKYLLGLSSADKRMKDNELVLRFASFYFNTYLRYKAPIKMFLNQTMLKYQHISETDTQELRTAFKNTTAIIRSLLDKNAFKRFYKGDERNKNGKWEGKKFNVSLYDILMISFAERDKNTVYQNMDRIREALIDLMTTDQDFINSIELSTSSVKAVTFRFDKWRMALDKILGIGVKETRCFTYDLKEELFNTNSSCAICGNKIRNIDDAAVDHIEQYWTGGKTIPSNARLTHRYCNMARSRTDVEPRLINEVKENTTPNGFDEVDNAKVKFADKIYIIRRYENNMIRLYNEHNELLEVEVKPILRQIIESFNLDIKLNHESGTPKNTQVLGKEVIIELKDKNLG